MKFLINTQKHKKKTDNLFFVNHSTTNLKRAKTKITPKSNFSRLPRKTVIEEAACKYEYKDMPILNLEKGLKLIYNEECKMGYFTKLNEKKYKISIKGPKKKSNAKRNLENFIKLYEDKNVSRLISKHS